MGQRTVTDCDGCGGVPNSDDYVWIPVSYGEFEALCCSVYCTSLVLRRWDAPVASLDPEVRGKAEEEARLFGPSSGSTSGKGWRNPFVDPEPPASEVVHEVVDWLVDAIEAMARRVAEQARPYRNAE